MPELPEVETVVRGLRLVLPGRRIEGVRFGKTDFIDNPAAIERDLPGCRIADVLRRGKYIVLPLERDPSDSNALLLILHLGMTGRVATRPLGDPVVPHTHAFFALDDGRELRFTDPRRFGRIALFSRAQFDAAFGRLGAEPLEISEAEFRRLLTGRRAMLKALLLNQNFLRGIGNIYADESLWRAKLHPARLGSRINFAEAHRLLESIRRILREAIKLGGSTISDFVGADGLPGEFQIRHRVYDREGKRCFRCGAKIRRIIVAGRSSYFCPRCQRAPRLRGPAPRERLQASNRLAKLQPVDFWEMIYHLRQEGKIPRQWRVSDLMPHLKGRFSANTIRTVPANRSISSDGKIKGNYVKRGMKPKAIRVGEGMYELIEDPK